MGSALRDYKYQKSKRDRECHICGKKIAKGTMYWRKRFRAIDLKHDVYEHSNCELFSEEMPDK